GRRRRHVLGCELADRRRDERAPALVRGPAERDGRRGRRRGGGGGRRGGGPARASRGEGREAARGGGRRAPGARGEEGRIHDVEVTVRPRRGDPLRPSEASWAADSAST